MRKYCLAIFMLFFAASAFAQQPPATDTTKKAKAPKQVRPGFELPDSLYISADSVKTDVDTIVRYTAKDSVAFDVNVKRMTLTNNAVMQFQNRELTAHTIVLDFEHNTLTAYSANVDSVVNSSLAVRRRIIRDTTRAAKRGAPKLTEGSTEYEGEVIVYNFKTKHGTVELGTTELEGGFYYGEKIKQVAPQTMFVQNGRYTTCDAPTPHYYFESPRMKVIMQDQVFAEPVYLYVADVPIFALPFGVFPNHSGGRHSGIIAPNYQTTGSRGYGLTHLGYYWVINDYLDWGAQTDLYTKGGYNIDSRFEWMKRYLLSGPSSLHLGYGYSRFNSTDPFQKNWLLQGSLPNLILGYETQLSANVSFQSNSYFQNNALNQQDYLTQQVNSNASFSTGWSDLGMNLGIDYSRSQNLRDGTYDESSPSLNFNKSTFFPFATADPEKSNPTLASLGIGYSLNAQRHVSKSRTTDGVDTFTFNREQYGVMHSPSISISPKLGHFSITPGFSYQEAWLFHQHRRNFALSIRHDTTSNTDDTTVVYTQDTTNGFYRLYNYNASVNVSTTLYGIANIGAFGIQAVRHTLQPQIGLSWHPDLSAEGNGVFIPYIDPKTHQQQFYNIFGDEINGGIVSRGKSASLNIGLGNDFEAKVEHQITKDSSTVDHVKLLNLNVSTGYDLEKKLLGDLSASASSSVGTFLSMNGTATYSFYPKTYNGADSLDRTLISLGTGTIRPKSASVTLDGTFTSKTTTEGDNYDSLRRLFNITTPDDEREFMLGGYYPGPFVNVPFRPTWSIWYGLSYSQQHYATSQTFIDQTTGSITQTFGDTISRNFSANLRLEFALTKNWSLSTSATYDLANQKLLIPQITIHRDLHCWEMNFAYRPPGSGISGFNFELRVKAPQLQDVKLTRTENTYGQF
jgi:hypothetical protein